MALLYTANMRFPLVEVETASDDTRQNIFYGPATGCNDSALLSDQKLQRRVPCMSLVFDCFSFARSGNQADVPLNYKQCQWSWGLLGNKLAELAMKSLRLTKKWRAQESHPNVVQGWLRRSFFKTFALFFMCEAAMQSNCFVCSLFW